MKFNQLKNMAVATVAALSLSGTAITTIVNTTSVHAATTETNKNDSTRRVAFSEKTSYSLKDYNAISVEGAIMKASGDQVSVNVLDKSGNILANLKTSKISDTLVSVTTNGQILTVPGKAEVIETTFKDASNKVVKVEKTAMNINNL